MKSIADCCGIKQVLSFWHIRIQCATEKRVVWQRFTVLLSASLDDVVEK